MRAASPRRVASPRGPDGRESRAPPFALLLPCALLFLTGGLFANTSTWQQTLSPVIPGGFPPPRPYHAVYRFGWSGFTAAFANTAVSKPEDGLLRLDVEGRTVGVVRALYRLDAKHTALADAATLLPIRATQTEVYRPKSIDTRMEFTDRDVTRFRAVTPGTKYKPKRFEFPRPLDIFTAMLFIRSQRLEPGDTYNFVVYPGTAPYWASVRIIGPEKLEVRAAKYNAIKAELKLKAINDKLELQPHSKFKRAFIWISDDADRLVLRVQADIFVGSVWAELERVSFRDE